VNILVPVKRVVHYNVRVLVKSDGASLAAVDAGYAQNDFRFSQWFLSTYFSSLP
jgi:hypothetical protein